MRVVITVCNNLQNIRRIVLRSGQVGKFGRTSWCDFSFPEDTSMSDLQFELRCDRSGCEMRAISQEVPTLVNEEPVAVCSLQNGDTIRAGSTTFKIELEDAIRTEPSTTGLPSATQKEESSPDQTLALARYYGLSEAAVQQAAQHSNPMAFVEKLKEIGLLRDAIRWYAHALPKPVSVAWGCNCTQGLIDAGDPLQKKAWDIAKQWSLEPNEEWRLKAAQEAEDTKYEGIGGSLAAAASWSGGSLAPPTEAIVPPDERLTGRAVHIALVLASHLHVPSKQAEFFREVLGKVPG